MSNEHLMQLLSDWQHCKAVEQNAQKARRDIEDEISQLMQIESSKECTKTEVFGNLKIKVTTRLNRKIDPEKLQELAHEHGVFEHLNALFRWKPEINAKVWRATNEAITAPLLGAITTTPSRASFSIETIESEEK